MINPKILGFGDTHLGPYKYPIREYIEEALMEVADIAGKKEPDVILFSGDAFRTRVPSARDISMFGAALKLMAQICPVIMIPGNHDLAGFNASTIDVFDGYENVVVMRQPDIYRLEDLTARGLVTSHHTLNIACVPWLPQKPMVSQGIDQESVKGTLEAIIQLLKARLDPNHFSVLLAHCSALGSEFATGMSTVLGYDVLWPSDWFDGFDLCVLGHLHKPAQVKSAPHAFYTGSICPVSFNETDHIKAVFWYDGENAKYIPLKSAPLFSQTTAEFVEREGGLEYGPKVFLQVVKDAEAPDPEIPGTPAWYEIISRPPKRETRQRLDSEAAGSLSLMEAIKKYLELEGQEDLIEPVYELARELMESSE